MDIRSWKLPGNESRPILNLSGVPSQNYLGPRSLSVALPPMVDASCRYSCLPELPVGPIGSSDNWPCRFFNSKLSREDLADQGMTWVRESCWKVDERCLCQAWPLSCIQSSLRPLSQSAPYLPDAHGHFSGKYLLTSACLSIHHPQGRESSHGRRRRRRSNFSTSSRTMSLDYRPSTLSKAGFTDTMGSGSNEPMEMQGRKDEIR